MRKYRTTAFLCSNAQNKINIHVHHYSCIYISAISMLQQHLRGFSVTALTYSRSKRSTKDCKYGLLFNSALFRCAGNGQRVSKTAKRATLLLLSAAIERAHARLHIARLQLSPRRAITIALPAPRRLPLALAPALAGRPQDRARVRMQLSEYELPFRLVERS